MSLTAAKPSPALIDYLLTRRSCAVKTLAEPGPDAAQIRTMLQAASRVPDHGKLFPWYFVVLAGDNRRTAGALLARAWKDTYPDAEPAKLELESERFLRAPVVIAVVSRMREGKKPLWEQILSAGAACQNLILAANALGFGTNWVTEWYATNPVFRALLGLDARDHVAGFIYIGTPSEQPVERDRPALDEIVTFWAEGATLNKGENYGQPGTGFPAAGFDLGKIIDAS